MPRTDEALWWKEKSSRRRHDDDPVKQASCLRLSSQVKRPVAGTGTWRRSPTTEPVPSEIGFKMPFFHNTRPVVGSVSRAPRECGPGAGKIDSAGDDEGEGQRHDRHELHEL